ncbi:hypothetical protein MtrunA17_Chr1g0159801 [Medicago truncatula]|uniref:Transmembrane protein, putative n=1 Tax=Medicago truncatula TaxID=3880 RepID=A0A072VFZ0_MEDTR|nr:transmembrane protein, putative [Medicago truncatula]RHN77909.1 hypothetical protein MtrunA17_Chr1g0159801 [Medicago truncatula]
MKVELVHIMGNSHLMHLATKKQFFVAVFWVMLLLDIHLGWIWTLNITGAQLFYQNQRKTLISHFT